MVGAGVLDAAHELVEGVGQGGRTLQPEERVRPGELHERHRDRAVLGIAGTAQQVRPHRRRQRLGRADVRVGVDPGAAVRERDRGRQRAQQPAVAHRVSDDPARQHRGGGRAQGDLPGGRGGLQLGSGH